MCSYVPYSSLQLLIHTWQPREEVATTVAMQHAYLKPGA